MTLQRPGIPHPGVAIPAPHRREVYRPELALTVLFRAPGLTDESVCPTLVREVLLYRGAGAFACQPPLLRPRRHNPVHPRVRDGLPQVLGNMRLQADQLAARGHARAEKIDLAA